VQHLLDELRNEGAIRVIGQRRWARWHLADSPVFNPGRQEKV
jgi:ATP-dependent DNA helicase RecG